MSVSVLSNGSGGHVGGKQTVASHLSFDTPTDFSLPQSTGGIAGLTKLGTDLNLLMANGDTVDIQDFFVIGDDGDFSRLLTDDGEVVVTGLMVPEADAGGDFRTAQNPEQQMPEASADDPVNGYGTDAGHDADAERWIGPELIAGAGLSLGSGISLLSGDPDGTDAAEPSGLEPSDQEMNALSKDIAGLMGDGDDTMRVQDYDPQVDAIESDLPDAAFATDFASETTETSDHGGLIDADYPALSMLSMDDTHSDIVSELMTESY